MLNTTRIRFFNKLCFFLTIKAISKELYCFNEDSYNIENFNFKDWVNVGDPIGDKTSVRVGITHHVKRSFETNFLLHLWQTAAQMKNLK